MNIVFTPYAEDKFDVLRRHGVVVSRDDVIETVQLPDGVNKAHASFLIAEKSIEKKQVLRVIYKWEEGIKVIVTFYPAKKQSSS